MKLTSPELNNNRNYNFFPEVTFHWLMKNLENSMQASTLPLHCHVSTK